MTRDKLAPRPGIKPVHVITLFLRSRADLTEKDKGILQNNLDNKFSEPDEVGQVQITFRTSVTQPQITKDEVRIETTTSTIDDDIVEELLSIVQSTIEVSVVEWQVDAVLKRKSLGVDEA